MFRVDRSTMQAPQGRLRAFGLQKNPRQAVGMEGITYMGGLLKKNSNRVRTIRKRILSLACLSRLASVTLQFSISLQFSMYIRLSCRVCVCV